MLGTLTLSAFLLLMSGIMSLLSLIFILVGLNRAAKDESSFRIAFILTFINLILAILFGVFDTLGLSIFSPISTIVSNGMSIGVNIMVFRGIEHFARSLYREDVPKFGKGVLILLIVLNSITILVTLLSFFQLPLGMAQVLVVLSVASGIATIVAYVLYLIYLSRAKNMLA